MKLKLNPMLVKLGVSALIIFVMYAASLITLNRMVAQATPPEGFVFERLPVVTGVYEYSEPNNRPQTKVGNYYISCSPPDFIQGIGTMGRWGSGFVEQACGLAEDLNGKVVVLEQSWTPTISWFAPGPAVTKISSSGKVFYERTDAALRELWIERSYKQVADFCLQIYSLLAAVAIWYFTRPLYKKTNESQPY